MTTMLIHGLLDQEGIGLSGPTTSKIQGGPVADGASRPLSAADERRHSDLVKEYQGCYSDARYNDYVRMLRSRDNCRGDVGREDRNVDLQG